MEDGEQIKRSLKRQKTGVKKGEKIDKDARKDMISQISNDVASKFGAAGSKKLITLSGSEMVPLADDIVEMKP